MRRLAYVLFLIFAMSCPSWAEESYQVLIVSPGYQKDQGLKKDLESIAPQFDQVIEAQGLGDVLSKVRKLGANKPITKLVFLGHGYLGDKKTGGTIDIGEDIDAASLAAQKALARKKGDSTLLDAFADRAEIVYFNCHAGLDPEFLKETAELFLGFSGGTVYGSDDYVCSKVSGGNQLLSLLNRFGLVGDDSFSFESPSTKSYKSFPKYEIKKFLWRDTKPDTISVEGKKQVPINTRLWLKGVMPTDWTESAYSKFIKIKWTENKKVIGDKPTQVVEFPKLGERTFTLEVFLDNGVGARKLGTATHTVKVVERVSSAAVDNTSKPSPTKNTATDFALSGPSEAAFSEVFALEAEVPQSLADKSAKIVWFYGTPEQGQEMVFLDGLRGVPGPLAVPGGTTVPQAHGTRVMVQPFMGSNHYYAELRDAQNKVVARTPALLVNVVQAKFQATLFEGWSGENTQNGGYLASRKASLDFDEKDAGGKVFGYAGAASFTVRWLSDNEKPKFSEISPKITTTGGFVGNGRYFVKGVTCFEVERSVDAMKWENGRPSPKLWQKWKPIYDKHVAQSRDELDKAIASIRVGLVASTTILPGQSAPQVAKVPDQAKNDTKSVDKVPEKPQPVKPDFAKVRELAKNDDYAGAQSVLLGYPQTPEVKKSLAEVNDWLKRAEQCRTLAAKVEELVLAKKLPSALEVLRQLSEIRNRMPSMPGDKTPEVAQAEDHFNAKKLEYDKDWNEYSYGNGDLFAAKQWEKLRDLAQHMNTWELFPGSQDQVRTSLRIAEEGLAAQSQAWSDYRDLGQKFNAGSLDEPQARAAALQKLQNGLNAFNSADSRFTAISQLMQQIRDKPLTPLTVRVDPPSFSMAPGGQMQTVAHGNGGTPPYSFEWYVGNERTGTINQVKIWKFNQSGNFQLRVVATDARGQKAEASCPLQVKSAASTTSAPTTTSSTGTGSSPTSGYQVTGVQATMGSRYESNCQGNIFQGGTWCSSQGGSDWVQGKLDTYHNLHQIRIDSFSTDVTTQGAVIKVKVHTPKGWLLVKEYRNTNINRTALTGGGRANSVGPQSIVLSPPQPVNAVRIEITGHGWFGGHDVQLWASGTPGTQVSTTAVDVSKAQALNFVGEFVLIDPARPSSKYHGVLKLFAGGRGRALEVLNGKPVKLKYPETADSQGYAPIEWSYDHSTQTFVMDWTCGGDLAKLGKFSGRVKGNTNDFTLSGHWANGNAANLRIVRR